MSDFLQITQFISKWHLGPFYYTGAFCFVALKPRDAIQLRVLAACSNAGVDVFVRTYKHVTFLRKCEDQQFCFGHNILRACLQTSCVVMREYQPDELCGLCQIAVS